MGIRIIIAGSRDLRDKELVRESATKAIKILREEGYDTTPNNITIICGEATGADTYGKDFGLESGYKIKSFKPDWKDLTASKCIIKENRYGKYNALAGNIRNEKMAVYAGQARDIGVLIAVQKGDSRGTQDMINLSIKYSLRRFVVKVDKDENVISMFR